MSSKDPISSKETLVLPDAMIGRKVGGYEIRGILGRGGMGVVYRAHDAALDREVALKLLPPALSADADYAERFIREARMAAKLDHPRIVPVYAAGSSDQGAWIAMQLVRGRTLAEELHDGMRPTFSSVLRISKQAAEALGAAHNAGLIHRDIKPGNLIVDGEGNIKVLDFGLARPAKSAGYTQDGTYLGTPEYSSPEQCQTSDIDGRADLYSLGCVMYEMLGGRIPHVAETPLVLFTKIVNEEPIALRDLNPKVPPSLAAIVSRLLAKNRDARYAHADALIADLEKVIVKDGPARPNETVVIGPADRARVAAWTLAGVLATLLVAAVIHSSPWSGQASGSSGTGTNSGGPVATTGSGSGTQPVQPVESEGRVVILDFKNITGNADVRWMESALPELIASSLATREGLNPLDREEVTAAMKKELNARLTSGGGDNLEGVQAQGVKVLEALHAKFLIRGSFAAQGAKVRVMVTVLVRRGDALEVAGRSQVEDQIENILGISDRVADDVSGSIDPRERQLGAARKELRGKADGLAVADEVRDQKKQSVARLEDRMNTLNERRRGGESLKKKHGDRQDAESWGKDKGAVAPAAAAGRASAAGDDTKKLEEHKAGDAAKGKPEESDNSGGRPAPPEGAPKPNHQPGNDGGTGNPELKSPADERDPAKSTTEEAAQSQADHHEEDSELEKNLHLADAKAEELLSVLRKYAEEIRENEKDLKEVELGAEGTAK